MVIYFHANNLSTNKVKQMAQVVSKTNLFSLCNATTFRQQNSYISTNIVSFKPTAKLLSNPRQKSQMRIGSANWISQRWWDKGTKRNMREVEGAEDLVESLLSAGDKLVIVDFYSPGCGGCKALHPKICQLAEMNTDVQFLQVNYEEHKSMCYALGVHVLPFFRFYRGAHGRLCSFSCTNATIKKFKDALAKHSPDRCSLGETKGLEEKELVALSANRDLSFTYTPQPNAFPKEKIILAEPAWAAHSIAYPPLPLPRPLQSKYVGNVKDKTLV